MESSAAAVQADPCEGQVVKVRVDSLLAADSPRLSGEDSEHVRTLAGVEDGLPPVLVERSSMRIIDGMHRLLAAKLRGQTEIDARFFNGDEASCFVLAVESNISHGLPLSLADRKAAASRIVRAYPYWSDRRIALATGISAKTVASIRGCLSEEVQRLDSRIGRDGRARPTDGEARRKRANKLIAENPDASLRQIAREAGISPETARGLRARLRDGGPTPAEEHPTGPQPSTGGNGRLAGTRPLAAARSTSDLGRRIGTSALSVLMEDPSLRSTDTGRALLRMLATSSAIEHNQLRIVEGIPVHSLPRVAEAARTCAHLWHELAQHLDRLSKMQSHLVR